MPTFHTITPIRYRDAGYGERVAALMTSAALWPLNPDERMTVLISAMVAEIMSSAESETEIADVVAVLRTQLALEWERLHAAPEDRH